MSSRIPSLLLPLCLLSAVALNVYPLIDPTGVYGSYLSKLDKKTPPVAAVALAAGEQVHHRGADLHRGAFAAHRGAAEQSAQGQEDLRQRDAQFPAPALLHGCGYGCK